MHLLFLILFAGGWERTVATDPMWDYAEETFTLENEDAILTLNMGYQGPTFSIFAYQSLEGRHTEVTYRFGSHKPRIEIWPVSHGGLAVTVPPQSQSLFLNGLLTEQRLIFRVTPHRKAPITVTFATQGLRKLLAAETTTDAWQRLHQAVRLKEKQFADDAKRRDGQISAAKTWLDGRLNLRPTDLSVAGLQAATVQDPDRTWGWQTKGITRYPDGGIKTLRLDAGNRYVSIAQMETWFAASQLGATHLLRSEQGTFDHPAPGPGIRKLSYQVVAAHGFQSIAAVEIHYYSSQVRTLKDWSFALSHILGQQRSKAKFYTAFDQDGTLENALGWSQGRLHFQAGSLESVAFKAEGDALPELTEVLRWLGTAGISLEPADLSRRGPALKAKKQNLPEHVAAVTLATTGGRVRSVVLQARR